jgi:hypothetical protein
LKRRIDNAETQRALRLAEKRDGEEQRLKSVLPEGSGLDDVVADGVHD